MEDLSLLDFGMEQWAELMQVATGLVGQDAPEDALDPESLLHAAFFMVLGGVDDKKTASRDYWLGVWGGAMRDQLAAHTRARNRRKNRTPTPPGLRFLALLLRRDE